MRVKLLLVVAGLLLIPAVVASAAVDTTVVVDYDPAAGELPEGVAVDKRGDVFVSLSPLGQVRKIDRDGSETTLAQIVPPGAGNGVVGLAVDAPGNVFVAAATLDPATSGVYKIARDGSFARLPGTGAIVFPNGVTLDKEGNVYVTDTIGDRSGVCPLREGRRPSGSSRRFSWATAASTSASRSARTASPTDRTRSWSETPKRRGSCASRSNPDGSAGPASILAEGLALLAVDGISFDVHGNVWACVIAQSTIVRVSSSGVITTMATAADGLDWASSLAFGKNGDLWVVNFAIGPPGGPGPALLRLDVGVKGQPVP